MGGLSQGFQCRAFPRPASRAGSKAHNGVAWPGWGAGYHRRSDPDRGPAPMAPSRPSSKHARSVSSPNGPIFSIDSKGMREEMLTGPGAGRSRSVLSGPVFREPVGCTDVMNGPVTHRKNGEPSLPGMPFIPVSFGHKERGSNRQNGAGRAWMPLRNAMFRAPWSAAVDWKRARASIGSDNRIAGLYCRRTIHEPRRRTSRNRLQEACGGVGLCQTTERSHSVPKARRATRPPGSAAAAGRWQCALAYPRLRTTGPVLSGPWLSPGI